MIKSRKRVIKSNEMNVITVRLNNHKLAVSVTAQKIRFLIKDFFSKCDQIRSFLRILSHFHEKLHFLYSVPRTIIRKN